MAQRSTTPFLRFWLKLRSFSYSRYSVSRGSVSAACIKCARVKCTVAATQRCTVRVRGSVATRAVGSGGAVLRGTARGAHLGVARVLFDQVLPRSAPLLLLWVWQHRRRPPALEPGLLRCMPIVEGVGVLLLHGWGARSARRQCFGCGGTLWHAACAWRHQDPCWRRSPPLTLKLQCDDMYTHCACTLASGRRAPLVHLHRLSTHPSLDCVFATRSRLLRWTLSATWDSAP